MIDYIKISCGIIAVTVTYKLGAEINLKTASQPRDLPLAGVQRSFVDIATLGYSAAWDRVITIWTLQQASAKVDMQAEEIHRIYMNAARLEPKAVNLYVMGCAALTFKHKRHDLSIDILKKGIAVFPENWTLHSFLALSYFLSHQDAKALEHYEIASKVPGSPDYLKGIVEKFRSQGNFDSNEVFQAVDKTLGEGSLRKLRQRLIQSQNNHLNDQQNDAKDAHE